MRRILPALTGFALVIAAGVGHGFRTDRWGIDEKVATAASGLDRVPIEFGDWSGETLVARGRRGQGLPGELNRRYTNRKTGDVIRVALVCGRPGPVAIHTPDVCYGASGFKVGKRIEHDVKGSLGGDVAPRFYSADMTKITGTEVAQQRLFWAWRADGRWVVSDNPRNTFATLPVLFKFYIARDLTAPVPLEQDPCTEFLRQFLPELEGALGGTV